MRLNPPCFVWNRTREEWDYLAEVIDTIIDREPSGHHHLTNDSSHAAIVVVSKGEYPDELLER